MYVVEIQGSIPIFLIFVFKNSNILYLYSIDNNTKKSGRDAINLRGGLFQIPYAKYQAKKVERKKNNQKIYSFIKITTDNTRQKLCILIIMMDRRNLNVSRCVIL